MATMSELKESVRVLADSGFLVNGMRVEVTLYAGDGRPVKLHMAEAAGYVIVPLRNVPDGARAGITNLAE